MKSSRYQGDWLNYKAGWLKAKPQAKSTTSILLFGQILLGSILPLYAAPQYPVNGYIVNDLGAVSNSASAATSINANAQVVGELNTGSGPLQDTHAFLWQSQTEADLGTLGGKYSTASGINSQGDIAGTAQGSDGMQHGFVCVSAVEGSHVSDLGTLGGDSSSAFGINNAGLVVGTAYTVPRHATHHAFVWYRTLASTDKKGYLKFTGKMQDLGTLGGANSSALAISGSGSMVGMSDVANGDYHACLWQPSVKLISGPISPRPATLKADIPSLPKLPLMTFNKIDLGTLGGRYSIAHAVNDSNTIVGQAMTATGEKHAFVFREGKMQDLYPLSSAFSDARGINTQGQIVGSAELMTGEYHAYVYSQGKTADLNTLIAPASGWILQEADAVNAAGQIVGFGQINGQKHAFLLTPTRRELFSISSCVPETPLCGTLLANHPTPPKSSASSIPQLIPKTMFFLGLVQGIWQNGCKAPSR